MIALSCIKLTNRISLAILRETGIVFSPRRDGVMQIPNVRNEQKVKSPGKRKGRGTAGFEMKPSRLANFIKTIRIRRAKLENAATIVWDYLA